MAKSQYSGSIPYGWYPDWLVNWYSGSRNVDLFQTIETLNTIYPKTSSFFLKKKYYLYSILKNLKNILLINL